LKDVHLALQEFDGNNYCTVCFAFLERDPSGAVHVSIALGGHPPPLLRRGDGSIEQLGRPGTLLGLITPTLHTSQAVMQPGDTIVLYTDGVTDAPVDLAVGVDDFAAVVMQSGEEPSSITTAVRTMLVERRPNGVVDDTALLVAKVVRPSD
jgi:sigma-B regulation protein RsbU (phosphoserine phosphatase)